MEPCLADMIMCDMIYHHDRHKALSQRHLLMLWSYKPRPFALCPALMLRLCNVLPYVYTLLNLVYTAQRGQLCTAHPKICCYAVHVLLHKRLYACVASCHDVEPS